MMTLLLLKLRTCQTFKNDMKYLGKNVHYEDLYNPKLLQAVSRHDQRKVIGLDFDNMQMYGADIWNNYECSWIDNKGKPNVGIIQIIYSSDSINIIESKSMKLYFMSFNNTVINDNNSLINIISNDISKTVCDKVTVKFLSINKSVVLECFPGTNIDSLDVSCDTYVPNANLLFCDGDCIQEEINSNLLKSNCKITNQPDWASIYFNYCGRRINHQSLLKYIVSYRNFNEFHEQCIEKIYYDIMNKCNPNQLCVYAKYTRRGGIDINPYRTNIKNFILPSYVRSIRQ